MTKIRSILPALLISAPLAVGCRIGGDQVMPMAANQSAPSATAQPGHPDLPGQRASVDATTPSAAEPQQPPMEQGMEEMDAQMKELGAQMKDMAAKMKSNGGTMKAGEMGAMDPGKMTEMGAKMKGMAAKMQNKGTTMKMAKGKPPPAAEKGAVDPGEMTGMGDKMMGMGDKMMGMGPRGAMDPGKMMEMGGEMMGMGQKMMLGMRMGKKSAAPMKPLMGTPPPGDAPMPTQRE